jgi:hypothetical protein
MTTKFKRSKNLGKWEQTSSSFVVSDPLFGKRAHKEKFPLNVRVSSTEPGFWKATLLYDKQTRKVEELIVYRDDLKRSEAEWGRAQKRMIPVDSGVIGIFNLKNVPTRPGDLDSTWSHASEVYQRAQNDDQAGMLTYGVVCKSGFGPGYFEYYTWRLEGKNVGVRICFITRENRAKYEREQANLPVLEETTTEPGELSPQNYSA